MTDTLKRRRFRRIVALRRRLAAAAIMAGWVAMPLMPVLAIAYSWLNGLS